MKKIIILTATLFSFGWATAQDTDAQPPVDAKKSAEQIQALYVAFVTKKLDLTTDEAKQFWPEHDKFDKEMRAVTETDEIKIEEKHLEIKKRYQAVFNRILGNDKCNRFFRIYKEFRRKLIERLQKARQSRPARRPGVRPA